MRWCRFFVRFIRALNIRREQRPISVRHEAALTRVQRAQATKERATESSSKANAAEEQLQETMVNLQVARMESDKVIFEWSQSEESFLTEGTVRATSVDDETEVSCSHFVGLGGESDGENPFPRDRKGRSLATRRAEGGIERRQTRNRPDAGGARRRQKGGEPPLTKPRLAQILEELMEHLGEETQNALPEEVREAMTVRQQRKKSMRRSQGV